MIRNDMSQWRWVRRLFVVGCAALSPAGCETGIDLGGAGQNSTSACYTPGNICTVAGTGQSVFDGDGRQAVATSLYLPLDVSFDASGQPLILDYNNLRIRRINADGTVETIMGLDYEDAPVDGALATQTALHHASDIEMDHAGNMYVAGNHVPLVFRVGVDHLVTIVAGSDEFGNDGDGGPARQAKLSSPFGVVPTNDGGCYFSDQESQVVRFVDSAGIINTVAGNGTRGYSGDGGPGTQAKLSNPTRLRLDAQGALYICDTGNHSIRRLGSDGAITSFVGTGKPGYTGDGGPAAQAQLSSPYDIAVAPNGDFYIADTGNNVIRRIDRNGIITTVVGTGVGGFSGDEGDARHCQLNRPSGINFAADGSMWIADTYNHRVRRVAGFLGLYTE